MEKPISIGLIAIKYVKSINSEKTRYSLIKRAIMYKAVAKIRAYRLNF